MNTDKIVAAGEAVGCVVILSVLIGGLLVRCPQPGWWLLLGVILAVAGSLAFACALG